MKVYDPGHVFELQFYSGSNTEESSSEENQILTFMHRIGENYPGNQGEPYDGTNCQEVLRALISRCLYLETQKPCDETKSIIRHLRNSLLRFEERAARLHGLRFPTIIFGNIEDIPTCKICGHIVCRHMGEKK